jgi:hypothetical protein
MVIINFVMCTSMTSIDNATRPSELSSAQKSATKLQCRLKVEASGWHTPRRSEWKLGWSQYIFLKFGIALELGVGWCWAASLLYMCIRDFHVNIFLNWNLHHCARYDIGIYFVKLIEFCSILWITLFHELCTVYYRFLFLHCRCGFVPNLVCWCCNILSTHNFMFLFLDDPHGGISPLPRRDIFT